MQLTPPQLLLSKVVDNVVSDIKEWHSYPVGEGKLLDRSFPSLPPPIPTTVSSFFCTVLTMKLRSPNIIIAFSMEMRRWRRKRKDLAQNKLHLPIYLIADSRISKNKKKRLRNGRFEQVSQSDLHGGTRLARIHRNGQSARDPLRTHLEVGLSRHRYEVSRA